MNDQTLKLVESLAAKLGTTAEHLFSVVVRQAPISAATDFIMSALIVIVIAWSFKRVRAYQGDFPVEGVWFAWCLFSIIFGGIAFFSIPGIISALLNPEYWALMKILNRT